MAFDDALDEDHVLYFDFGKSIIIDDNTATHPRRGTMQMKTFTKDSKTALLASDDETETPGV